MTVEMSAQRASLRPWAWWVLAPLAALGLYFGVAGYAMAASFSVSNPENLAHWRRVAMMYLGVTGLSLVGLVAASVVLWRRRRRGAQG